MIKEIVKNRLTFIDPDKLLKKSLTLGRMAFCFKETSRKTDESQTCIDNICISKAFVAESATIKTLISDHYAQKVKIKVPRKSLGKDIIFEHKRNLNEENIDHLNFLLSRESWEDVLNSDSPENSIKILTDTLN